MGTRTGRPTGRPRGRKNSRPTNRWTPAEWKVIAWSIDTGLRSRDPVIAQRLPGRTEIDIRNARNILRRKREGICICGTPTPGGLRCNSCKDKALTRRRGYIANGCCAKCGDPIDEGGSTTNCSRCITKARKYRNPRKLAKRRKELMAKHSGKPLQKLKPVSRIVPWYTAGNLRWLTKVIARTKQPICDPFGGTGHGLNLVHQHKGWAHSYNEIHPGMYSLVKAAYDEDGIDLVKDYADYFATNLQDPVALWHAYRDALTLPGLRLGALTALVLTNNCSPNLNQFYAKDPSQVTPLPRTFVYAMKKLQKALLWSDTEVTNVDALEAVSLAPHDAVFLLDPPWPGKTTMFEHRFEGRVPELLRALHERGSGYALVVGSNLTAVKMLFNTPSHESRIYWRRTYAFVREVIALSPSIDALLTPHDRFSLEIIDPKAFGFKA